MRTILPDSISTEHEAIALLTDLHNNNETFHPEDNAHDIIWATCSPTKSERDQLNALMSQMYTLPGFEPCKILVDLLNS